MRVREYVKMPRAIQTIDKAGPHSIPTKNIARILVTRAGLFHVRICALHASTASAYLAGTLSLQPLALDEYQSIPD
jgi:hypothetical protein